MSARATLDTTPNEVAPARAKPSTPSKGLSPARATLLATPRASTPAPLLTIRHLGEVLDDLERVRVANGNQIAAAEREYGSSLPHLEVVQHQIRAIEHQAHLELCRAWRHHPLAPWAKGYMGLGEKSIARLIAIIGDPADRTNVAKLWSYCGFGAPERIRIPKNATQSELMARGNPRAKKQTWLISTSMLKAGNREVYDATRAKYAHLEISDGHKHARAIRAQAKSFLRDLWVAARADRPSNDIQWLDVGAGEELS